MKKQTTDWELSESTIFNVSMECAMYGMSPGEFVDHIVQDYMSYLEDKMRRDAERDALPSAPKPKGAYEEPQKEARVGCEYFTFRAADVDASNIDQFFQAGKVPECAKKLEQEKPENMKWEISADGKTAKLGELFSAPLGSAEVEVRKMPWCNSFVIMNLRMAVPR